MSNCWVPQLQLHFSPLLLAIDDAIVDLLMHVIPLPQAEASSRHVPFLACNQSLHAALCTAYAWACCWHVDSR